jgi:ubiquinone/menaquinone biosynthesis C-methylase UbiE
LSRLNDRLYTVPAALEAFDLATFPNSEEARLGANAFLAPGDLAYFEETLRRLRPAQAPASGPLVDLGCGRGALGRHLAEKLGLPLVGIDTSTVALEQAAAAPTTIRARWVNCDFAALELETGSVASAISLDGIYLAVDPRAMLREVSRILMQDAPLIFTVCVPRFREGALDWRNGLRDHHFEVLEYLEVSEPWHAWLRTKAERRVRNAVELSQRLDERDALQAIDAAKAILAGDPPWFKTQRRYRITARRAA